MTMTHEPVSLLPSTGPADPPALVRHATVVLFVLNGLALGWALFLLLGMSLLVAEDEYAPAWLALPAVMAAAQIVFLVLTWKVRRGSRAAWVTTLVLSGVQVVTWLALTVAGGVDVTTTVGAVIMLLPAAAVVAFLVAPASSRRYFLGR